ncbi:MAG: hypothetical protein ACREU2_05420, partial [Steroidobacteraceae bacterium]
MRFKENESGNAQTESAAPGVTCVYWRAWPLRVILHRAAADVHDQSDHRCVLLWQDVGYRRAIGGLIAGVMARWGSRAIQGHGIPEAMER